MRLMRSFLLFALLVTFVSAATPATVEGQRVWINKKNQKITASLVKVLNEKPKDSSTLKVTFKLKNGKKATFPVAALSEPHQKELLAWLKQNPMGRASPSPPFSWPKHYSGSNTPKVEYVKFDPKRKAHLYRTAHFDFYLDAKISDATVSKCVAVFDSIVEAIDSLPMEMDTLPKGGRPRYQVVLVSSREKYMQMGGLPNSGGFFAPGKNLTVIPFRSLGIVNKGNKWVFDGKRRSFETLTHELTHHSTHHWYGMPPWFQEGLAEYMSVMPYQSGRFLFTNPGGAITSSVRKFKKTTVARQIYPNGAFNMRKPKDLFATNRSQWNGSMGDIALALRNYTSSMIMVYFFMHEDGDGDGNHFIQWMHAWRSAVLSKRGSQYDALIEKHLLRGRSHAELEKEIQDVMSKKGLRLNLAP